MERRQTLLMNKIMVGRVRWLIVLRWMAAAGLVATAFVAQRVVGVSFDAKPILLIALIILGYNAVLHWLLGRHQTARTAESLVTVQILADLLCLTAVINFTGGLINPCIIFMMFHAAIAGIILSRQVAFLLAGFAGLLVVVMGLAHMTDALAGLRQPLGNYPLERTVELKGEQIPLVQHPMFVLGVSFVMAMGLFLSAYLTSGIALQLRQAYRELAAAHVEMGDREEAKSMFMRTMAHQLRSPLAAITSLINAMAQTGVTLPERVEDIHQRIKARSASMMDLVDDILRLAQIREGAVSRGSTEPIDAVVRFREIVGNFEATARDRKVMLEAQLPAKPAMVLAAKRDLNDLLGNLISNAIKYTRADGSVKVEVRMVDGALVTQVRDTGIGIPAEEIPQLFGEFFRAANAKKQEAHSSGLGLSICKEIVDRLGGRITCQSAEGVGTTFRFELPVVGSTCSITVGGDDR